MKLVDGRAIVKHSESELYVMRITNNGEKSRAIKRIDYLNKKLEKVRTLLNKFEIKNNKKKNINTIFIKSIKENIAFIEKTKAMVISEIEEFDKIKEQKLRAKNEKNNR